MVAVLAFTLATGGYGGYYVSRTVPNPSILSAEYETQLHMVTRIIDGDTIALEGGARVRLLGINAPEAESCYAAEATQALSELILGQKVILQKDSTALDSRGRLLRYVFLHNPDAEKDNVFVNNFMVRQGHAISSHFGADRRYEQFLNNSMGLAKREVLGMHKECGIEDDYMQPTNKECIIKGNNNYGTSSDIYYLPSCFAYSRLKLRWSQGDEYFCTEKEAVASGYRRALNCPKIETEAE